MKTRIEIDEMGRHIMLLPEELIEEFNLDEGDLVTAELLEEGVVLLEFLS